MARIDYYDIEEKIKLLLQENDEINTEAHILIEKELTFEQGKIIAIYLDRRDAPANIQSLSAGTRTRFNLQFTIWVFAFSLELQKAIELRDDLLGKVELVLMADRTLKGSVASSYISGGEFENVTGGTGFMSGASIELVADKTAVSI